MVPSVLTKTILMGGRTEFRPLRPRRNWYDPRPQTPVLRPGGARTHQKVRHGRCVSVFCVPPLCLFTELGEGNVKLNEPTFNESSQKWGTTAALRPILHLGSRSMYPPRLYPPGGSTQVYPLYPLVPPCTPLYPPSREQEPVRVHLTSDTW